MVESPLNTHCTCTTFDDDLAKLSPFLLGMMHDAVDIPETGGS